MFFSDEDYEKFVISVAQRQKNKEEIAYLLNYGEERTENALSICESSESTGGMD